MVIQIQQRGFGVGGRYGRAGIQVGRQQQRPQEMRISRFIRSPASFLGKNCFVKLIQRCKFFLVYEIELVDEKEEMSIARVQMGFDAQGAYLIKVIAVYVRVDPEETADDGADGVFEVLGKRNANFVGEYILVIEHGLGPIHQSIHIFWSRELGRPLVLHAVFPEIFVSWTGGHDGAFLSSAEFGDGAIQHI